MSNNALQNLFAGLNLFEVFKVSFGVSLVIIIFSTFLAQLIINHTGRVWKLLSEATDIDNNFGEKLLKILQKLALNNVLDWILDKLDAYHPVYQLKNIGYGEGISLFFSILLIIISPKGILVDEWISLSVFSLLVIEKLWRIIHLESLMSRVNQLEIAGAKYYQENQLSEALRCYRQALISLYQPWISLNTVLDRKRAELLEQIAIILDNQHQFSEALINYNRVLTLFNRPHLLKDQSLNHTKIRLLRRTAAILFHLGDRKQARQRCQLIYKQTGKWYNLPRLK